MVLIGLAVAWLVFGHDCVVGLGLIVLVSLCIGYRLCVYVYCVVYYVGLLVGVIVGV